MFYMKSYKQQKEISLKISNKNAQIDINSKFQYLNSHNFLVNSQELLLHNIHDAINLDAGLK